MIKLFSKKNNYERFSLSSYLMKKLKKELDNEVCEVSDNKIYNYPVKSIKVHLENVSSKVHGLNIRLKISYIYTKGDQELECVKGISSGKTISNYNNFLKNNIRVRLNGNKCLSIFKDQYYIGILNTLYFFQFSSYELIINKDGIVDETWMLACDYKDDLLEIKGNEINHKIIKKVEDIE